MDAVVAGAVPDADGKVTGFDLGAALTRTGSGLEAAAGPDEISANVG